MNLRFKLAVVAFVLAGGFSAPALAGPFEDGLDAARRADYPTVMRLWRPLADQGDARAQLNLGLMYANGRGVSQDYAAAITWYQKAADQGDAEAQLNLGLMYASGRGVPKDPVSAHMWFSLAAAGGDKAAEGNRQRVAAKMSPGQIAKAQGLANGWKPK
jgi:uncharacterized protein